jgi:pyruvate dehydrogenase E1 component beta subunit
MWSAIADPDPVIILEAGALYETTGPAPDDDQWSVPIGKARVARAGEALTIVTYGSGVALALDAAEALSASGVSAEVIDLRTLRPLDMPAVLASVRKTGRLLTLDDAPPACSIGAEICAGVTAAAFSSLKAAPVRMAAVDTPVPFAANLEALVLPAAEDIAAKALRLAEQNRV